MNQFMSRWQQAASTNVQLLRLGRRCHLQICVVVDDLPWYFEIASGRVVAIHEGPFHLRHSDLQLQASRSAWEKFFRPLPPRGFHDLLAMSSYFSVQISGNQDLLRENLAFVKALFAIPRQFSEDFRINYGNTPDEPI